MEVFSQLGVSLWTCGLIGLITILYMYLTKSFDYWKKRGVKGPKPHIFIGTFKPPWKYRLEDEDMKNLKKYGRFYGGFESSRPTLLTTDPDIIKQITVKDFASFPNRRNVFDFIKDKYIKNMLSILRNDEWKVVRNTLTPTFTTGKLKQMVYLIEESVSELVTSLEKNFVKEKKTIEFNDKFPVLTLDVIASCAFGTKIDCIQNPETEFVVRARKIFRSSPVINYVMLMFFNVVKCAKYFPFRIVPNPFKYFVDFANKTIDMRLQNKQTRRKDFLEIMLNAEVQEDDGDLEVDDCKTDESIHTTQQKKTLTRDTVVAQTILFLLAGYETTANTLCFMAYELATNPTVQEKLIAEVDETMIENKGKLTYEAIASMQYLDMVLSETLRHYPPATRLERLCEKDGYELNGITLENGMLINILVYALHHDPEFFPNPHQFDPERFSAENKAKRNPFTYIPFGVGPRSCIAMRFALMEAKISIVMMLSKFRFQATNETDIPLKFTFGLGFLQADSVKLLLQKRTDQPNY